LKLSTFNWRVQGQCFEGSDGVQGFLVGGVAWTKSHKAHKWRTANGSEMEIMIRSSEAFGTGQSLEWNWSAELCSQRKIKK